MLRETSGLLDLLEHLEQAFRGADEHALERLGQATTLERIAAGAAAFGGGAVEPVLHTFRDGFLPYLGEVVKDAFEDLKRLPDPDLVLTHARDDLHQDHRLVNDLTWNTFRNHLILEYEIPKYDGDLGRPNVYVPVSEEVAREKVELVADSFPSQAAKDWFDEGVFLGLMRLRGMEARAESGYAEAFTCRKLVLRAGAP